MTKGDQISLDFKTVVKKISTYYPDSLIVELHKVFGDDMTEKFILVFGGTTLKIPSTKAIRRAEREIYIYEKLHKTVKEQVKHYAEQLGERFGVSYKKVMSIYKDAKKAARRAEKILARSVKPKGRARSRGNLEKVV